MDPLPSPYENAIMELADCTGRREEHGGRGGSERRRRLSDRAKNEEGEGKESSE